MSVTHKKKLALIQGSFDNGEKTYSRYEINVLFEEISLLKAEVERLKAKCNRLLESLENEGVYQDYNDYVAEKE